MAADRVLADLFKLVGGRLLVANPRRTETEAGGGDFDLIVEDLDHNWPLRMPPGWRLAQMLWYDIGSWYWVLDHAGETVAMDTVEDPDGPRGRWAPNRPAARSRGHAIREPRKLHI